MSISDYPYERIYDTMANHLVEKGLPKEDLSPGLFIAFVNGDTGAEDEIVITAGPNIAELFDKDVQPVGKILLRKVLNVVVESLPENACALLVVEAYARSMKREGAETIEEMRARAPQNLSQDPEAEEVVSFHFMRRGESILASMPITRHENGERTAAYRAIDKTIISASGAIVPEATQMKPDTETMQ